MQRVVILGGGVGGTLTANLVARKLKRRIARGAATVTVVDLSGKHTYQPGYMYIALGNERPERLVRSERSLLDSNVKLVVDRVDRIDVEGSRLELASGASLGFDQLVVATGARILPEAMPGFEEEAHHFYSAGAAMKLRRALDGFRGGKILIGIAGIPYKCPPAPLEVAFLIEAEMRERGLRDRTQIEFLSPINRAFTIESVSDMATPIFEEKGIDLQLLAGVDSIDPERKVVITDAMEEYTYDLLICVPPQGRDRLRAGPEVGLDPDRPLHAPGQEDRTAGYARRPGRALPEHPRAR
ncbi:MAG: FAD-dependent oxidoreductase [Chloroflexi bacterium]|nr:FAD-dependent oxidoreductase [Chloroflexota bacterium]